LIWIQGWLTWKIKKDSERGGRERLSERETAKEEEQRDIDEAGRDEDWEKGDRTKSREKERGRDIDREETLKIQGSREWERGIIIIWLLKLISLYLNKQTNI
jgi:hypothetical protein